MRERRIFKFSIGDKVRIQTVKGDDDAALAGMIGIVSAIYDPALTPNEYPRCEYRVTCTAAAIVMTNKNTAYCVEDDLSLIKTLKAYAFKKGKQYHWFSDAKARKGYVRDSNKDHEFEE